LPLVTCPWSRAVLWRKARRNCHRGASDISHRLASAQEQCALGISAASFVAIFALNVPFPAIVAGAAIIGYLGGRIAPGKFKAGGGHGKADKSFGPALIDDDTPTPEHARFRWSKLVKVAVVGGLFVGCADGVAECRLRLASHTYTNGLVLYQGRIADLWRSLCGAALRISGSSRILWLAHATQMIDGLALGETTPGPLIMVVAFVGFVGGYVKVLFGPDSLFLAGAVAATLVTWFTFLPSFLFILAGGPLVESTHGDLKFTAH